MIFRKSFAFLLTLALILSCTPLAAITQVRTSFAEELPPASTDPTKEPNAEGPTPTPAPEEDGLPEETSAPLSVSLTGRESKLAIGGTAKWSAKAQGGAAPYTYAFSLYQEDKLYKAFPAQESDVLEWKTETPGQFTVSVAVTDAAGAQVTARSAALKVLPPEEALPPEESEEPAALAVSMQSPRNAVYEGFTAQWTAEAQGGAAPYTYTFSLYREEKLLEKFPAKESGVFEQTFLESGFYTVSVTVTDAAGKEETARSDVLTVRPMDEGLGSTKMAASGTVIVPVTGITGVPTTAAVGVPLTLTGTVAPSDATNKTIVWSVAPGTTGVTISGNTFKATALVGFIEVHATIQNGLGEGLPYTTSFIINVATIPVTNITGVPTTATADVETDLNQNCEILPLDATSNPNHLITKNDIIWTLVDTGKPISGGKFTPQTTGSVTVKATIADGLDVGKAYTQTFTISVIVPTGVSVTPAGPVTISTLVKNFRLVPSVTPANVVTTYTWSSSNSAVATVIESGGEGFVDAVAEGEAVITVETANGKKASVTVIVKNVEPQAVTLTPSGTITINSASLPQLLTTKLTPENAVADYSWVISPNNSLIMFLDPVSKLEVTNPTTSSVLIAPKAGVGTTNVTVLAAGKPASVAVKVEDPAPESITLTPSGPVKMGLNDKIPLTIKLNPTHTIPNYDWSESENTHIAKAVQDTNGDWWIESYGPGNAEIKVKVTQGSKTVSASVNVIVEAVTLDVKYSPAGPVTLAKGAKLTLTSIITPTNANVQTKVWSSKNPSIATVDQNGVVTALQVGSAVIMLEVNGVEYTPGVTVNVEEVVLTGLSLTPSGPVTIGLTQELELIPKLTPANAQTTYVDWTSSNTNVASVDRQTDANGNVYFVVSPRAVGTTIITVKTSNNNRTATVTVNVAELKPTAVKLVLDDPSAVGADGAARVALGDYLDVTPVLTPVGATTQFTWSSSNTNVAYYDTIQGRMYARAEGTAVITVRTANNLSASMTVRVVDPNKPESIALQETGTVTLPLTSTPLVLTPKLFPEFAITTLTWTSSNSSVATVTSAGVVQPYREGTTVISVRTSNNKMASVTVKVVDMYKPETVALDISGTTTLNIPQHLTLTPTLTPADAATVYTWTSSNPSVATVNPSGDTGDVRPLKEGTTVITVKTSNNLTARVTVYVVDPYKPDTVTLNYGGTVTLSGGTLYLWAQLTPYTAATSYTWSSSNSRIATLIPDTSGGCQVVAAWPIVEGTTVITVKTSNNKTARVTVRVVDPNKPDSIALDQSGTVTAYTNMPPLTLTPLLSPPSASGASLTWASSNQRVATVSQYGEVTPLMEGTTVITVKTTNNKTARVTVRVVDPNKPDSVKLSESGPVTLNTDGYLWLLTELTPNTAQTTCTWSSSNTRVADVYNTTGSQNWVMPNMEGTTVITVKTSNNKIARVTVRVVDPYKPTTVALDQIGVVQLNMGSSLTLTPTLTPRSAHDHYELNPGRYTWLTSNPRVASVTNGVVTGDAEGSSVITVRTANNKIARVTVRVVDPDKPLSVAISPSGVQTISRGGPSLQLTATPSPLTAVTGYTWTSSNPRVASVDPNGLVTAGTAAGTAVITVKTTYNNRTARITVRVN